MDFQTFSNKIAELDYGKLKHDALLCRGDILTMTTLAASGHPGGSMSTIDALLTVYNVANISKNNLHDLNRDRIFIYREKGYEFISTIRIFFKTFF